MVLHKLKSAAFYQVTLTILSRNPYLTVKVMKNKVRIVSFAKEHPKDENHPTHHAVYKIIIIRRERKSHTLMGNMFDLG